MQTAISTADEIAQEEDPEDEAAREVPLRAIRAVTAHIPAIDDAREKITREMETMVLNGLATLVSLIF